MKKGIVFGIGLVILIVGLMFLFVRDRNEYLEVSIFRTGFRGEIENIILRDYEEFIHYFENLKSGGGFIDGIYGQNIADILEKYKYDFFRNGSLALVYVETGGSSWQIRNVRAVKNSGEVIVRYRLRRRWQAGTLAEERYIIVVEIPKNVSEITVRERK